MNASRFENVHAIVKILLSLTEMEKQTYLRRYGRLFDNPSLKLLAQDEKYDFLLLISDFRLRPEIQSLCQFC